MADQTIEILPASQEVILQRHEVQKKASVWPERARALMVRDAEEAGFASRVLAGIKEMRAEVAETFEKACAAAFAAHREITGMRAKADGLLNEAERIIKDKLGAYAQEMRRKADEEARLLREAEERRLAEERESAIKEAEASGADAEEVTALCEAPLPPVVIPRTAPAKVAGVSLGTDYDAELMSLPQLVSFVAANPGQMGLLLPNMPALKSLARATKSTMQIPGVRFTSRPRVSARG